MIESIRNYVQSLTAKNKYLGIGFIVGVLTPCAITALTCIIKKIRKVQREQMKIYVGIELGGSPQFDRQGRLINFRLDKQIDGRTSDDPHQTIRQISQFLSRNEPKNIFGYDFVGIASFGPLCLNQENRQNYGTITSTPKQHWRNCHLLTLLDNQIKSKEIMIETDVNAAALAEFKLGNHKCRESLVYVTVGTGVGVGVITQGKTLHGLTHPEGGHIIVKRSLKQDDSFNGVCPYHKDCLEGMVANKSIAARLNIEHTELQSLEDTQPIWEILGDYLGQLCLNVTLMLSPEVIVVGGGIMNRRILYQFTREYFLKYLAQYVENPLLTEENIKNYIKEPKLGNKVGVKGAMILNFAD